MHLTALVDSPDHVCCRYRLAAFRPFLHAAGHSLEIQSLPRRWWSWLGLQRRLREADAVILQRRLLQAWQRHLLRRASRFLVFDLDDAVFHRDSYAAKGLHSRSRLRRFTALVRAADMVTVGNSFLGREVFRQSGASRAFVIPTCVDPSEYPLARHAASRDGVKLVWVGSSSTLRGLEMIAPLLEAIGRRVPEISLKLICDRFLTLEHLCVEACPWTESGEAAAIAASDIGISYLPDDLWSRGKCGLKVLQYMAAGLPVVANPVGVQADMVRDGVTGFLVNTPAEWVEAIARLAGDPVLRRRMGREGRQRVEQDFSVSAGAARWLDLISRMSRANNMQADRDVA